MTFFSTFIPCTVLSLYSTCYYTMSKKIRFMSHVFRPADRTLTRIENRLEALGKWEATQKLRYFRVRRCGVREINIAKIISIIEIDICIQDIVQRETFLIKECQSLYHQLSTIKDGFEVKDSHDDQRLQSWLSELEDLNKEYWRKERKRHSLDLSLLDDTVAFAFRSNSRRPKSYLHRHLRFDCARRGGCCGRSCGCCERPRSETREKCFGHCTTSCGCCQSFRGFEIKRTDDDHKCNQITTNSFRKTPRPGGNILSAHIFGL